MVGGHSLLEGVPKHNFCWGFPTHFGCVAKFMQHRNFAKRFGHGATTFTQQCFSTLTTDSARPFDCGFSGVESRCLVPHLTRKSCVSVDVKVRPPSVEIRIVHLIEQNSWRRLWMVAAAVGGCLNWITSGYPEYQWLRENVSLQSRGSLQLRLQGVGSVLGRIPEALALEMAVSVGIAHKRCCRFHVGGQTWPKKPSGGPCGEFVQAPDVRHGGAIELPKWAWYKESLSE